MNSFVVENLARIYAIQAEIDGMKAENWMRVMQGLTIAYGEETFLAKSSQLQQIANHLNEMRNRGLIDS